MIGQNSFTETEDSPLTAGADGGILTPDPEVERERIEALEQWKAERDEAAVERGARRARPRSPPTSGRTSCRRRSPPPRRARPPASGRETLREVFGAYRGPTGVDGAAPPADREQLAAIRARVDEISEQIGHRIKILVGKPGLDGHSNGAEQIALRARDVGMEVIYQGIRLTPERDRRVGAAGGRRRGRPLDPLRLPPGADPRGRAPAARARASTCPVVVGGIIPPADAERLREAGVAGVYTPKDFDVNRIMGEIVDLVAERAGAAAAA